MKHGQNCDCMMCGLGKKMGMIPKTKKNDEMTCEHCGRAHKADSACDQK